MCEQIVICTARDEVKAARILDDLRHAGFSDTRISVLVPEMAVAGGFVPLAGSESSAGAVARTDEHLLGSSQRAFRSGGVGKTRPGTTHRGRPVDGRVECPATRCSDGASGWRVGACGSSGRSSRVFS